MSQAACCFCGLLSSTELAMIVTPGGAIRARLPLCTAHGAAMALGDWTLTVKAADMVRSVSGHKLPLEHP
jgi:hypothetical protein